jgi:putative ABC transport system permease protein
VVELDTAVDLSSPIPAGMPPDAGGASLVRPIVDGAQHGWTQVAIPYVANRAVLALYRVATGAIGPTTEIVTSRHDLHSVQLGTGFKSDFKPVTVQVSPDLPNYTSAPNTLITPKAMTAYGYSSSPAGWLIQSRSPLTASQITDAQRAAAVAGITIETRTGPDHGLQQLRDDSTLAGVLVALGVLAMTVGLIRSETAGDLRTLAATGASNATRRALNATSAAALALLGGILGVASAYLALIAWHWHDISYLNRPPYGDLAVLTIGLPAVAAIGAALFGRSPSKLASRPLE